MSGEECRVFMQSIIAMHCLNGVELTHSEVGDMGVCSFGSYDVVLRVQFVLGKLCVEVTSSDKMSRISEELCIGCGICVKVRGERIAQE